MNSNDDEQPALGSTEPRLWTPPLRELTPETSYGFDLIDFANDVCGVQFDPWQEWLSIHAGELLPDGRPRFRQVLVLVSRQNGKTTWARVLTLYWLFVEEVGLVLGTSSSRGYAKEAWSAVVAMAKDNKYLARELRSPKPTRDTTGEETLFGQAGQEYRFAAANRRAGRSLTVDRLIVDEVREHHNFDAWNAGTYAMQAVPTAQVFAISNQGDATAVVLDYLRVAAVNHIETGEGDPRTGLFEYSAPAGADPEDPDALAMANPSMGIRIELETLIGQAKVAKASGGEALAGFRTEAMCQRVHLMDAAIDEQAWAACEVEPVDLAGHRDKVALCLDIALDGSHATLIASAVIDDVAHLDVVQAWDGYGCIGRARKELPGLVAKVKPRSVGWFPQGPAAAMATDMRANWAPRGCEVEPITADMTAACMGLAASVTDKTVAHFNDPMLNRHATTAQKLLRGDAWVFTRRGSTAIDGAYAAAGAVLLARMVPPPKPKLVVL